MAKYTIQLAQLVRETALVEVEADSLEAAEEMMDAAYEDYDGEWTPDIEWGAEAGTHFNFGLTDKDDSDSSK